jgi:hypothetical protein
MLKTALDYLNKNSGAIQTITTVLLAILTGLYVFITGKLLGSAHEEHEAAIRPYLQISVYVRSEVILCLVIKNIGRSAANKVSLSIDKDIFQFGEATRNVRDFPLFSQITESIPPAAEYHIDLDSSIQLFSEGRERLVPKVFTVTATYSFFEKKPVVEKTGIDLRGYESTNVGRDPLVESLKSLKKEVVGELKDLVKGIKNLKK